MLGSPARRRSAYRGSSQPCRLWGLHMRQPARVDFGPFRLCFKGLGMAGAILSSMTPTAELLDRITINPNQCGGRPCIRGIRVSDVLALLAAGRSQEEILQTHPSLEVDDITACLLYAIREENADPDRSQIMQRLRMTPKQRLAHLVEAVAFQERAHRARRVG